MKGRAPYLAAGAALAVLAIAAVVAFGPFGDRGSGRDPVDQSQVKVSAAQAQGAATQAVPGAVQGKGPGSPAARTGPPGRFLAVTSSRAPAGSSSWA